MHHGLEKCSGVGKKNSEVRRAYNRLLLVFPHEPNVTALKELII